MFQYTNESIINSLTIENEGGQELNKIQGVAGVLRVLREGDYKKENIVDGKIYKTAGNKGVKGKVEIDFSNAGANICANAGNYQFSIMIQMHNKYLSDFAEANWYPFSKPVVIEFNVKEGETAETTAQHLANLVKEAVPYNNVFAVAKVSGTKLTVSLTDCYANIANVQLQYYSNTMCDSCLGEYLDIEIPSGNMVITRGQEPFATGAWIQENLRFPSYPNVRYAGMYSDERPIVGDVYTMYSFECRYVRHGLGGLSAVGQHVESTIRNIFYVNNKIVDQFEAQVKTAFGENVLVEQFAANIINASTVANDNNPVNLMADIIPANPSVTVTWSLVDESGEPTTIEGVTVSADKLTVASTVDADTVFYIKATPSNSGYKAAIKKMTVVAA